MRTNTGYKVVVNHEEQYSIWPADKSLSGGWRLAGKKGSVEECMNYIEEVWTDMKAADRQRILDRLGIRR